MSLIQSKIADDVLTLYLSGRIDSSNAADADTEIEAARNEHPHTAVVLDADKLEYLSSAGLRVMLRLLKSEKDIKLINASTDVYDIFEMTGFTELFPVEKAYRKFSVEGCQIIGQGAKGTVYRYNADTIIKVYKNPDSLPDILNERELARRAFVLGIPTAISYDVVKVGESYGSVFELLDASSFSQLILEQPEKTDEYIRLYAELLKQIHSTMVKEEDMPDIKIFVRQWRDAIAPHIPEEQSAKIDELINATPDTLNMLHCDYHTNNVMMQNGETLLIDMDTLSHGHPIFELANIYITYVGFGEVDPTVVEKFIGLPYSVAKSIWEKFLPLYLDSNDPDYLTATTEKVQLLSYIRLMRHTVRRGINTPNDEKTVQLCKEKIAELLNKVDTLTF